MTKSIAVVVGSVADGSINRKLAEALVLMAPEALSLKLVDLRGLPIFNYETEDSPSPAETTFRAAIRAADGLIFVTPEYNRSIPGALKNALDIGSRPAGQNAWSGKPAAMIGTSPGAAGTAMAQHHLRGILAALGMPTLSQPAVHLRFHNDLIAADGKIGPDSHDFVARWLAQYADFVERLT